MLNRRKIGDSIDKDQIISHLLYMDDLKLLGKDEHQLREGLEIIDGFSNDIQMEFGLDKCAIAVFRSGKLVKSENIQLNEKTTIRDLNQDEVYKYLGVDESDCIQHSKMKQAISKEYLRRVRLVLKTELSSRNKIAAINSLAVPVPMYILV